MAPPPVDRLLSPTPAYPATTTLDQIALALGQPGAMAASHVVVLDSEARPLGAIALGLLWARYYAAGATLRLLDCQPWPVPLVVLLTRQLSDADAVEELATSLGTEPGATLLVAVDADGRYQGTVNPSLLLAWVVQRRQGHDPAAPQRAWVLELSHALKTPMTTLLGLSTLLLDSRVGSLSDRQFRYVSLMRQAIRKLTSLVNLLLDWLRLESDQLGLQLDRVPLQPLADGLLTSFFVAQPDLRSQAPWATAFRCHLAPPAAWLQADPLRLRQSLHYGLSHLLALGSTPGGLAIEPWGPAWVGLTLWGSGAASPAAPLGELEIVLAQRLSQIHGGDLSHLRTARWGHRITLLLPAPGPDAGSSAGSGPGATVLVLVASASEAVADWAYGELIDSPYRLVVAPSYAALIRLEQRLQPACTLVHWPSLPDAPAPDSAPRRAIERQPQTVVLVGGAAPPTNAGCQPQALTYEPQPLRPVLDRLCQGERSPAIPAPPATGCTVLLLRPLGMRQGLGSLPLTAHAWFQQQRCTLIQVDDLAQANLLSRVWQPQAILLEGAGPVPLSTLAALTDYPNLMSLTLLAAATPATIAAAHSLGLYLVDCSEVLNQPTPQAVAQLLQAVAQPRSSPPTPETLEEPRPTP